MLYICLHRIAEHGNRVAAMLGTHQHNQHAPATAAQVGQCLQGVVLDWHVHSRAQVNLTHARASAGLGLGPLHLTQRPLLLGQGRVQAGVLIVSGETGGGQLVGGSGENGLAEVLGPELAHERQARRREEHLLAHLGGIGNVGDGDEARRIVVAPEENVERLVGFQVRRQLAQVGVEVGRRAGEAGQGPESLRGDGDEKAELRRIREEGVELGDELFGS